MNVLGKTNLAALIVLACASSCTTQRGMKITEVGVNAVELYLDEPSDETLRLRDVELRWKSHGEDGAEPESGSLELNGDLDGGDYLVVWEKPSYSGPPNRELYTNHDNQTVHGIAVAEGTFGTFDNARSYAFRIYRKRYIYIFPFFYRIEEVDDVVEFGPAGRPDIGGEFAENGDLNAIQRSLADGALRGQTVWRKTRDRDGVDVPYDTDTEANWRQDDESFGKAK